MDLKIFQPILFVKFLLFGVLMTWISFSYAISLVPVSPGSPELKWHDAVNLPKGAKLVILTGDPHKKEFYTALLKLPANFMIPAHAHITDEYDTVISGIYYMGIGDRVDEKNTTPLPPGSFVRFPANIVHYGFTKKETVIEISGIGPWGTIPKRLYSSG